MVEVIDNEFARLPQLDALLRAPELAGVIDAHGRRVVTRIAAACVDEAREHIRAGNTAPAFDELVRDITDRTRQHFDGSVRHVINATGVVLHTNLGRAPLSADARDAVARAAGYSTIEYDLTHGRRGSRTAHVGQLAADVSGTQAATVVNNGAAALVLVLAALAGGRDTIVSRGELIEIGGSYRLPDVMTAAGTRLVEVGTTNRTHLDDYAAAVTDATAVLLKVHRSNYQVVGFTADVDLAALVELGRSRGVPVVFDLGSGLPQPVSSAPLSAEPTVADAVAAGADLVIYSGDKLLGGPQAGVIAGDAELVRRCTTYPLARALRIDKLQRAALEATLLAHLRDDSPVALPVWAMLMTAVDALHDRAQQVAETIGSGARAVACTSVVGGGASPGGELDSWGVALPTAEADSLATRLRRGTPPVIATVREEAVVLDLRTVPPDSDETLIACVTTAWT
ncbi:MAG: L-seryl-tRNA(Sec) selenium transferase [Nitriliruptoraceae bacterium]